MTQITGTHASQYSYLPGDNSAVTAIKFTRLDEGVTPRLPQNVKSVMNTQQTLRLITDINACIKKLGIDASSCNSNAASLAEQLNKLEMITCVSRRGNEEKLNLTEEVLALDEKTIKNNKKMIYQIEQSNNEFFRFENNQVKGYKKNLLHACKMTLSAKYKNSVKNTEKLTGRPTAENVKGKLLQFNRDKSETVTKGYDSLLTLTTQKKMHDELLKKINELRDNLNTPATSDIAGETQSAEFTVAEKREIAEVLTELADTNHASSKKTSDEKTVTQQDHSRASAASSSAVIKMKKRPAPPAPQVRSSDEKA